MKAKPQRRALLALTAAAVACLAACASPSDEGAHDWQLVWQDEFEGPAGQLPAATKWRFDIGTDWGNAQLEYDTGRPENASLDGAGNLAITARREAWLGRSYTSARITTRGLFEQAEGRYEARIKMPRGKGIWPAFWLLGANQTTTGWPACGEIDITEFRGQNPSTVLGTVHGPGYSGTGGIGRQFDLAQDRFDTGFHTFALEWTEASLRWYVDDKLYQVIRPGDLPAAWVFDHPFYIILNVAVGGGFVGSPDASTPLPQAMLVDYVRVYQSAGRP